MSVAAVAATFSLRHLLAKSMTSRTNQGRRANPEDSMNPRSGTSTGDSTLEHRRRKRRHKTSAHGFGSCGIHQGRKPATASDSDLDSSSTESLPDYFCRRQNRDDELIDDLFGTVSELTNPRQSDHPRRPARRPAEKSTFFACGDIMTSSDEELAEGGIQEFYGNQSDLEYSLSNCPVVVCKSSFQASRPCEVSVSVGDSLWMLSPAKPEESSVDTARYLTVVKKSNRHHGIVPTHVLEALGEHNSQTFFHGRDRFAECKDAIERGRQCPHEQTRARVLTKHNGVPIRLSFAVGMAGHDRGRGLFAMEDIPANTVLEKCPFILDDIDKVKSAFECVIENISSPHLFALRVAG